MPCFAVVAVATRSLEVLAEVAEEKGTPARSALRVPAHHLDPRSVVLLPMLLRRCRVGGRAAEVAVPVEARDTSVREHLDDADLLETPEHRRHLRLGEPGLVAKIPRVDGRRRARDRLGDLEHLVGPDLPCAREEAPQTDVLGTVV